MSLDLQVQVLLLSYMTLNKFLKKDLRFRFKYLILEIETTILKSICNNQILPLNLRIIANHQLKTNNNSLTKIRNLCIYTGRTRGIIRKLGISRFIFKNFYHQNK